MGRKKLLALLLAAVMIAALGACSKKTEPEPDPAPSNAIEGLPGLDGGTDGLSGDDMSGGGAADTDGGQPGQDGADGGTPAADDTGEDVAVDGQDGGSVLEEGAEYFAVIEIRDYGTVRAVLYPDKAPLTVANFVKLAEAGFYDGLTFHRIMAGFMIQGGDPLGNGTGGSQEQIYGEFSDNGWRENDLAHERGVLSMARASDFNSASSQFFIMHADANYLDNKYAAFGRVTEGIEYVDAICEDVVPVDDNGTVLSAEQPVIESVRIEVVYPDDTAAVAEG